MSLDAFQASPLAQLVFVGVAGIVVWHLIGRGRPNTRLVVQIAFFAVMTAILIANGIAPQSFGGYGADEATALLVVAAKLLWWVHLAWAVIGFVRIYLVLDGRPREARLLQDLIVGLVYLGMILSVLAFVFGAPIGTLVATSGVIAIILGLALQNTLGDVFSGIALTLGRPYAIGDWILLSDGTEGRVVESNWRSTHLLTAANNFVVLPNGLLAKLGLTNVSRPDETHWIGLTVRVAPTRMPSIVVDVMRDVLLSCTAIVKEPPPVVALKGLDATALEVELQFRVTSPAQRTPARNEVLDLVYRHCKSAGLLLAMPPASAVAMADLPTEENAMPPQVTPLALIEAISIFSPLTRDEKAALAAATSSRAFREGDVIARQGDMLRSLMMVRAGVIEMRHEDKECGRLAPGDFFGETGLLAGMGEACTLTALTRVTVYEMDQHSFAPLLRDRPTMAEDLAQCLSRRAERVQAGAAQGLPQERSERAFLKAIRTIFRG
ncbi:mechanosensitive ion channel family protein [Humitalea sp. 24SJ18S-53]|uniref:mechanosensitive ion channel family protein n=1 Tax=Humitalea sp. 24SJ18S-53 TaxID=3422307 RepID=UPI003D674CC8